MTSASLLDNSPTSFGPGNSICIHLTSLGCRCGGVAELFGSPTAMDASRVSKLGVQAGAPLHSFSDP